MRVMSGETETVRSDEVLGGAIDHAPFIAHPIEVGWRLRCNGQPDEVIAAGLPQDVLEKTATTRAELRLRFGVRIARFVASVSDDPSIGDCEERKRELRGRVARGDSDTRITARASRRSAESQRTRCLSPTSHKPNVETPQALSFNRFG